MAVEIKLDGVVIRRSRNLRGILDHAGRVGVRFATVQDVGTKGNVIVSFCDNSCCETLFADFTIALDWLRRRRWGLQETKNTPTHWSFAP